MKELNIPDVCAIDIIQYLRDTFMKPFIEVSLKEDFKVFQQEF
jgi:hypothetical protein